MDRVIQIRLRHKLLTKENADEVCDWLRRVPGSREGLIKQGTTALYAFHESGGLLLTGEGKRIPITPGVFDNVHSALSDGEWISEQRRRKNAKRVPRKSLLSRYQIYDGLARVCSRPIDNETRREHVSEVRALLRRFSPVFRARYVHEMRKLRAAFDVKQALLHGAAVRQIRARLAAELAAWEAQ